MGAQIDGAYRLTPTQSGILATCLASDDPGLYVSQLAFDIDGALDLERWRRSWQRVHDRHAALRSFFRWRDRPDAIQIVHSAPEFDFEVITGELGQDTDRFELSRPPLTRHRLRRIGEQCHRHYFIFHHGLIDGWSTQLILRDVLTLYDGGALPPNPPAFSEYVAWLANQDRSDANDFWQSHLAAMPPTHGGYRQDRWRRQDSLIEAGLAERDFRRLADFAKGHRLTLNTCIVAAWVRAQSLFYGDDDIVTGFVDAGRGRGPEGVTDMVGLLLTTLPLRIRVDANDSVLTLLSAVQATQQQAIRHAHIDPQQLRHYAGLGGGPLYDSVCVVQNLSAGDAPANHGANTGSIRCANARYSDNVPFPISLLCTPRESLSIAMHFNSKVFPVRDCRRLSQLFVDCLRRTVSAAERAVGEWPGVSGVAERVAKSVTVDSHHVDQRFRIRARQHPDRSAIRYGERHWRYQEADETVSALATRLQRLGVGPNRVVALCMANTDVTVLAMLAVLRAGGAFCVIDVTTPMLRLRTMMKDLAATWGDQKPLVLYDTDGSRGADAAGNWVEVRALLSATGDSDVTDILAKPADDDLAYVLFTSGSTGEPKGVCINHANLAYATNVRALVYPQSPRRFLLLSSLFFDSAMVGLFWTLTSGGELVVPEEGLQQTLSELGAHIDRHTITHTLCLPSVHALLLAGSGDLKTLTDIIVAGEPCPPSLPEAHRKRLPWARLYNEYGPTEATVWATVHRLDNDPEGERTAIGKALPGSSVSIVDTARRQLPAGALGELVITGPGVSRGYLGRDDDTAHSFFHAPGATRASYATGDLVRSFEDGNIEFVGRADDQIKVRGQRFELGELRHALAAIDDVTDCAVMADAVDGGVRLHAHVQCTQSESLDDAAILSQLAERVGSNLLPGRIHVWPSLPRLANGKLDYHTLRAGSVDVAGAPARDDQREPTIPGDIERSVTKLWRAALGVSAAKTSPRARENFFQAGGDSLAAVKLLIDVNRQLGGTVSIADFYRQPSVQGLVAALRQQRRHANWSSCIEFGPDQGTPLVLAYGNGQRLSAALGDDYRVIWLVHGRGATVVPTDALCNLAKDHVRQLLAIQKQGPYRLIGFSIGALLIIEIAHQLLDAGHDILPVVLIDPTSPAHYAPRNRLQRLRAVLRHDQSSVDRREYLLSLAKRAPGIICDKLTRRLARMKPQRSTLIDLPLDADNKREILALVDGVMRDHVFSRIRVPSHLVLVDRGHNRLERMDESLMWQALADQPMSMHTLSATGGHTELFRDAAALDQLTSYVKRFFDGEPAARTTSAG